MIKDVTDLRIYNEAQSLIPKLYDLLREIINLERDMEFQIKKAAKSVPTNIAEGFAKRHFGKEFKRYLQIALGSSDEVISHLRTLSLIHPEFIEEINIVLEEYKILSKRINSLHSKWLIPNR